MRKLVGILAAAACLGSGVVSAITVDELVARHVEALGGEEKLKAIRTLRLTGKAVFGGEDFTLEAAWGSLVKRPGMIRTEVTLQGLTAVDAYDGREGWSVEPFGGRRDPERASADEAKNLAREAELFGPLVHWRQMGYKVEYLGTEDVDGTSAHKLRVNRSDGDVQYVFLDPDFFLPVRVVTESKVRGAETVTETDYGDYERVEGVFIPFSVESGRKGRPKTSHITIERAEANVEADDALFRFPASGTPVVAVIKAGPAPAKAVHGPEKPPSLAGRPAPTLDAGILSGLGARNIGSATMSGRISCVTGQNDGGKTTLWVGAASGGVWKSPDGGTTFKPVFDKEPVQSIGSITVDPANPRTVWVGTGETWTRNSVSAGDGIYKSTDGGETWENMGLKDSERIDRILVNPKNDDVVFACVPGRLWSDSPDRGVYRTTDGGKSWREVLKGANLSTGCSGLAMNPKNPDVLLAGMWDFRRKGWTFRSGGDGPKAESGSGLFRTTDGGKTWSDLAAAPASGLPAKPWGRVEVALAPSDARIVYTFIESTSSALYRSSDGGDTWEARDRSQGMVWRPFYFARITVDPLHPDRLFKGGGGLIASEDGGRSFAYAGGRGHGDWHDIWIDPDNPKHVVGGDDGGLWISWDGGSRWWKSDNLPVSQFYHVSLDEKDPYQVYGGLQDNGTFVGDSSYPGGITNSRWESLYDGDGFWAHVDPSDPEAVYAEGQGGYIGRIDRRTHTARDIQPKADYGEKLRFNWNTPIAISPTDPKTLYLGSQFLFRSRDRGDTWERISPDLTTNDPMKQKQEESGGVTVDNSSAEMHTTIFSISESPLDQKVIWVGTDDGNVQLTRDSGKTWTNVVGNLPGLPPASWVSWVEASRFDPATAYAAFDRHTFGDFSPWVFRTTDFGASWTRIAGPEQGIRGWAHVIREDTVSRSLLFLGTEFGLFISIDRGAHWVEFKGGGFPAVAVDDLAVQRRESDLVLATHGRGIWIVDDLTPLRALSNDVLSKDAAFLPGRPVQERMPATGGWVEGDAAFVGENPAGGAVITYLLRARHLFGPIKLEILDAGGKLVGTLTPTKRRGINRVSWSMQVKPPRVPRAAAAAFSASQGPRVVPGSYTVRLTRGSEALETPLAIGLDRRAPYGVAERKEQFDAVVRVHALFGDMSDLVDRIEAARAKALARAKGLAQADPLAAKLKDFAERMDGLRKKIVATKEGGMITGEERIREHADQLYGALQSWEGKPARTLLERTDALRRELDDVKKEFEGLKAP